MSILPNFLITGILAMLIGLAIIIWSVGFVQRKQGGLVLMLLSIALLLVRRWDFSTVDWVHRRGGGNED